MTFAKAPWARCTECPLLDQPFVPGCGPARVDKVIVGQAPADEEVLQGVPFVGPAGKRLDKALATNGVDRSPMHITNTVLCQPVDNESPPPEEAVAACHERLILEIGRKQPSKVLALGVTAASALTKYRPPIIGQLRLLDSVLSLLGEDVTLRVTYHPSPSSLNRDRARSALFDEDVGWLRD